MTVCDVFMYFWVAFSCPVFVQKNFKKPKNLLFFKPKVYAALEYMHLGTYSHQISMQMHTKYRLTPD